MIPGDRDQDTVCAISTPIGVGGISVIRICGPNALIVVRKACHFLPTEMISHRSYHGLFCDHDRAPIDDVLVLYLKQGHSYTGDETLEISCHGSPFITQKILTVLVRSGARLAKPGEFTYRAFINGKIDLVQAEGVLSLIQSQSDLAGRQALRQLQGALSSELEKVENDLLWSLSRIEVGIDFSAEDVEVVSKVDLIAKIQDSRNRILQLLAGYNAGKIIRDGLKLVLIGQPNVGKSSLLNCLAQEERAIISDMPGTTRDLVDARFVIDGVVVRAVDTAGLRKTSDLVEQLGIKKTYQALSDADLVLFIFDLNSGLSDSDLLELSEISPNKVHLVGNKKDVFKGFLDSARRSVFEKLRTLKNFHDLDDLELFTKTKVHFVSALDKTIYSELAGIVSTVVKGSVFEDQSYISQVRHFENLSRCLENVERALVLAQDDVSSEFVALELKEALILIHETLGKRFDDQVMDRVFKEFCIGK